MFTNSKRYFESSRNQLAAGVASNLRLAMKPVPVFIKEAKGSKMIDEDGNELIDYILAYGPQVLGHSHPVIAQAVREEALVGQCYGAQHTGEIKLADSINRFVPCSELVSFCSTGTEAVQLALKISRAYTGRKKIVKFDGHYHGWADTIFTEPTSGSDESLYKNPKVMPGTLGQYEGALGDLILLPWNDFVALEETFKMNGDQIAAVITEPIMCNSGCISALPGYLEKMRELTLDHGNVLIFDEVITGFRLGLGGAQAKLGITPDLVTLGKAVAGGLPLSVVGGKREMMNLVAENKVVHMGTMNGNPLSIAAANASIGFLSQNDGQVFSEMESLVGVLVEGMRSLAEQYRLPLLINNQGTVFHTMFTREKPVDNFYKYQQRDSGRFSKLAELLMYEGIAVRPSGLWYISTAHTRQDIDVTLEKMEKCFKKLTV